MDSKILKAQYQGELEINDLVISCAVLEDGTRVISERSIANAIGAAGSGSYWEKRKQKGAIKPRYLYAKFLDPYISDDLLDSLSKSVIYKSIKGVESVGLKAEVLPKICNVWIKADRKGAIPEGSRKIAEKAYNLLSGFATVGIIALIDEATGYQHDREKDALQQILKAYISEELLPWKKQFPDELYREIFRLNKWDFTVAQIKSGKRPGVIGHWTKQYIYSALPKGVLGALMKNTPKNAQGKLTKKLHQSLTREEGIQHLNNQIVSVVTLMNVSDSWSEFERMWNKKFAQQQLSFGDYDIFAPKKQEPLSDFDKSIKKALNYNPKKK